MSRRRTWHKNPQPFPPDGSDTVRGLSHLLEREAAMYKRLGLLQGTHVPVFLGSIDM
jgi:hypothetical protein